MMVREFIEGWDIMQLLGEGTFAEVKLLVNRESGEACAMKEINLTSPAARENLEAIRKEICVHKLLKHPNIVHCYGSRAENDFQYIFLEYCSGGELFDRIEPEVGMPEHLAHKCFVQLLSAVSYLHERGIAHRDIKPENLLLSGGDVLKLSDFGMATVFRHKGRERPLERRCGTMPYIAPEVLMKNNYNAGPSDLWSCGVVLVAMLSGELPWDCPTPDQPSFEAWRSAEYGRAPWNRIDPLPLSLVRKILTVAPSKRYTLEQIENHLWTKKKFKDQAGNLIEPILVSPPLRRGIPDSFNCASQPLVKSAKHTKNATPSGDPGGDARPTNKEEQVLPDSTGIELSGDKPSYEFPGFSQPAMMNNCFTGTQQGGNTQSTQPSQSQSSSDAASSATHARFQRLVKRMTRFWVDTPLDKTETHLRSVLSQMGYGVTARTKGIYTVETTDRRGTNLVFKVTFISVEGRILLDFRMSRGCGLEFKKHFGNIKTNCHAIVSKAPILWTSVLSMDALPGGSRKRKAKKDKEGDEEEPPGVEEPKAESMSALE